MNAFSLLILCIFSLTGTSVSATATENNPVEVQCLKDMKKIVGRDDSQMASVCKEARQLSSCTSVNGTIIYHYDKDSKNPHGKRILAFALIHGDEGPSATVARTWMERLSKIDPQNHWRIVPILNPDGWNSNTRVNSHKIDLNRNFPTKDFEAESKKNWASEKNDPRRNPGEIAGSEPETKCAIEHIEEFKPTFIISVHTPYGVLDFDGPRIKFPEYSSLPWFALGNYPGSMGRYMWVERKVPTLTIELKGNDIAKKLDSFDRLQDVTGIVAIQSEKILKQQAKKKIKRVADKEKLDPSSAIR